MIMVEGEVSGKKYREPFSKGVLARSLTRAEMDPKQGIHILIPDRSSTQKRWRKINQTG